MTEMIRKRFKNLLRGLLSMTAGGRALLTKRSKSMEMRKFAHLGSPKEVFRHHYEVNAWGDQESVSGPGSTTRYTENIRKEIPKLVEDLNSLVILDAPCGDYNWFKLIQWESMITYIGGDIVDPLIEKNQALYGSANTTFIPLDIVQDKLPSADLWICRDCLFHLSNDEVQSVINNFLRSDIRYLLTSTHPECDLNHDIPSGSFRLLNLQLPPFNLGDPIRVIDDWIEGFPVRHLALWERETLKNHLASNRALQQTDKRRR